ncbi:MAG: sigma-70 family RNA polymerase sigma factor [Gaiellaceae bacterium]
MVAVPSIGRATQVTPRRGAPEADATRDLYERYARQIYTYCLHQLGNREEAEDAVQSTFLNAFRGFQRGVDPEFESAWLYKIAQNVCLTRQRSSSRRRRVESASDLDSMQDYVPAHEVDPDELINLPEALDAMPHQQRKALLLREWQGLSYKEIAEELDLSQAAVETLLFRARRSLAAGLGEEPVKPVKKSALQRVRSGGDAGSVLAIVKSLLFTGGAKVAVTVATVAATSVVAASPATRQAFEHAVAPTAHSQARAHQVAGTPRSSGVAAAPRSLSPKTFARAGRPATTRKSTRTSPRPHVAPLRTAIAVVAKPAATADAPAASAPSIPTPTAPTSAPAPTEPSATPAEAPAAKDEPKPAKEGDGQGAGSSLAPAVRPAKKDDSGPSRGTSSGASAPALVPTPTEQPAATPPVKKDDLDKSNGKGNGNAKKDDAPVPAPAAPPATTATAPDPAAATPPQPAASVAPSAPADSGKDAKTDKGDLGDGNGRRK